MIDVQPPNGIAWTHGQEQAVELLNRNAPGVCSLMGYAGTGKSLLLAQVVRALATQGIDYQVCCPTGKAASRLRSLGISAGTIHSWIYIPIKGPDGALAGWTLRTDRDIPSPYVLLVDEASMVGPGVFKDLCSILQPGQFGRSMILFGDGFQLPPILSKDELDVVGDGFTLMDREIMHELGAAWVHELTEVARQAGGNAVLAAATAMRNRVPPPRPDGANLYVQRGRRTLIEGRVRDAAHQEEDRAFLTWTNADRCALNKVAREERRFTRELEVGETLVVLANHPNGLCNGDLIQVDVVDDVERYVLDDNRPIFRCRVTTPYSEQIRMPVILVRGPKDQTAYQTARAIEEHRGDIGRPIVCDYGYVLTCHKAQGSEFDTVEIYAPDAMQKVIGAEQTARWLYTAITRAKRRARFYGGNWLAYSLGA